MQAVLHLSWNSLRAGMVSNAFVDMELGRVSLINNHGPIGGQPHTMCGNVAQIKRTGPRLWHELECPCEKPLRPLTWEGFDLGPRSVASRNCVWIFVFMYMCKSLFVENLYCLEAQTTSSSCSQDSSTN